MVVMSDTLLVMINIRIHIDRQISDPRRAESFDSFSVDSSGSSLDAGSDINGARSEVAILGENPPKFIPGRIKHESWENKEMAYTEAF
jgi:hypothetical protein